VAVSFRFIFSFLTFPARFSVIGVYEAIGTIPIPDHSVWIDERDAALRNPGGSAHVSAIY
jgi:hypothetical protein